MYSQQSFTPGSRSNTMRMIQYIAEMNAVNSNPTQANTCYCQNDKYDKNTPSSNAVSAKVSRSTRITQLVNNSRGGNIQFGNQYLGQPLNVNYLGKMEGMLGGGGTPIKNRF